MRFSLTASMFLALGLILPDRVSLSGLPEDMEGSGNDLEVSGSGEDPDHEGTSSKPGPDIVLNPANGNPNTAKSSSFLNTGSSHRHDGDAAPKLVVISNSESLLENKEVAAAAIAGGLTGGICGVLLSAMLIYRWMKKHKEEAILSQKKASDEDYHKPIRDVSRLVLNV